MSEISVEQPNYVNSSEKSPNQNQKKINSLINFFNLDNRIKEVIRNSAYPYGEELGSGQTDLYRDVLFSGGEEISKLFEDVVDSFNTLNIPIYEIPKKIKQISNSITSLTNNPNADYQDLKNGYQKYVSRIDPKFVKKINQSMVGYYVYKQSKYYELIEQTHSFNELLHLTHSYLLSDEKTFQSLPQIDQLSLVTKKNQTIEYTANGQPNKIATEIFSYLKETAQTHFKDPQNSPYLEVPTILHQLSIDNTILLMVRDFGHALTIQINTDNPKEAYISYQVPKIFDGRKVNQLPGVSPVKTSPHINYLDIGTSGNFVTPYEKIASTIFNFIQQVPTDQHH